MEELETPTSSLKSFNINPNLETAGAKAEPQVVLVVLVVHVALVAFTVLGVLVVLVVLGKTRTPACLCENMHKSYLSHIPINIVYCVCLVSISNRAQVCYLTI